MVTKENYAPFENHVADIVRHVRDTDARFAALYTSSPPPYPIPFFGNLETARVITIGVNPSSKEFAPWRSWKSDMTNEQLTSYLFPYFQNSKPKPHPWFAPIEEALNILDCSYQTNTAHTDLSPRATKAMSWLNGEGERSNFLQMIREDVVCISKLLSVCSSCRAVFLVGSVISLNNSEGQQLKSYLTMNERETFNTLGQEKFIQFSSRKRMADEVWNRRDELKNLIWS
jgi:hypothetical protein